MKKKRVATRATPEQEAERAFSKLFLTNKALRDNVSVLRDSLRVLASQLDDALKTGHVR